MEPTHTHALAKNGLCHNHELKGHSPIALGAAFTTLPCGLFMHYDTSLYALTDVIREARRLISGLRMVITIGYYFATITLINFNYFYFLLLINRVLHF